MAEDSSGIQYSDTPPSVTGKTSRKSPANSSNPEGGTNGSGQSSTRPGSTGDDGSGDRSKSDEGGGAGAGKNDGTGGSAANKGGAGAKADGSDPAAIDAAPASSDDDGGSSPLVPILIALAVLAAISIGVVAMRRKRQGSDPGSPISPEAS